MPGRLSIKRKASRPSGIFLYRAIMRVGLSPQRPVRFKQNAFGKSPEGVNG
jgi:hypothetical protein